MNLLLRKIYRKLYKLIHPTWGEVLMLHRVVKEKSQLYDNKLMEISPDFLEKTIVAYKEKGYQLVSLDELYYILAQKKRPKKKFVCFTLDDGYIDNFEIAYPIFKKHDCPFVVYVTTDFPDQKACLWWYLLEEILLSHTTIELGDGTQYNCTNIDEKNAVFRDIREKIFHLQSQHIKEVLDDLFRHYDYSFEKIIAEHTMSWQQIQDMSTDPLCTIGSHTQTHAALDKLNKNDLIRELKISKTTLEKQLKCKIEHFAYPYGRYNSLVCQLVEKLHYKTAVLAHGGNVRRPYNRLMINRKSLLENM